MELYWLIFAVTISIFSAWFFICNDRTFAQRRKIMQNPDKSVYESLDTINKVSYDRHLWMLLTFRNPYPLYQEKN